MYQRSKATRKTGMYFDSTTTVQHHPKAAMLYRTKVKYYFRLLSVNALNKQEHP